MSLINNTGRTPDAQHSGVLDPFIERLLHSEPPHLTSRGNVWSELESSLRRATLRIRIVIGIRTNSLDLGLVVHRMEHEAQTATLECDHGEAAKGGERSTPNDGYIRGSARGRVLQTSLLIVYSPLKVSRTTHNSYPTHEMCTFTSTDGRATPNIKVSDCGQSICPSSVNYNPGAPKKDTSRRGKDGKGGSSGGRGGSSGTTKA
ncbi:uncharacterized protein SCHCODRAFT_01158954 [Schizophyllum commune H4-8]|nr:uncharacterized protein SCHCODRAFT_01158954 [Schizophyllum commune H4-8]KAI5888302.1 hypothetical protein SCHCODRAFT_01158954 [Schizophyllum commune H4-8]